MTGPERQCIGCGRRAPQADLLRLTVDRRGGIARVVVDDGGVRIGRGAYLCRRVSCLDRAVHRRAFQRAFRATVVIEESDIAAALTGGTGRPAVEADGG